VVCGPGSD